ncbi:DUF1479-domain-containing protein [Aaosphaeria arxii CBS 175.79]|uniref:DUF1479-domain-containing protein n=1 Tax=Aaosphaeria arxii CBS 175.79 TaxID=1450172 RepID=A0A6A5XLQ1_9PLEO|nr:DUF1479-domain-containing protein [Aaosphaeria arxii CBS 175.79]KAF2014165.1 DUF1479-domain-containing protein [Aaosphaeria arxii CBS 175.79]
MLSRNLRGKCGTRFHNHACSFNQIRSASSAPANRSEGSIGDAFATLSKSQTELPLRFSALKKEIVGENGDAILDSWHRILGHIKSDTIPRVQTESSAAVPEVEFRAIAENNGRLPPGIELALKKCGTIIVRGLVPEQTAWDWKQSVRRYVAENPSTKGFPKDDIQVYELFWSKAQLEARAHSNMLMAQKALNAAWKKDAGDRVVLSEQISYCDRLRMRTPGDKSFNLGPHLDGGSLERWEDLAYRKCYTEILRGDWEQHDAFRVGPRLDACVDMYNGPGGCSAFRSYQGWLSLSECGPSNGTLRVIPDLTASTAYTMLRPFVTPTSGGGWQLDTTTPVFHGAAMGAGQELSQNHYPHISSTAFVSIPFVCPGDAVFWHCDAAHMVEHEHQGDQDASVFYIPVAPLCDTNIGYLKRQRANFLAGLPPPDFPGGVGESEHVGRGTVDYLSEGGKRAMGCARFDETEAVDEVERGVYRDANAALFD